MGSLLVFTIQPLEVSLIVEVNIGDYLAMQQFKCCDAANRNMHGISKN
jgi:hypothetical protein